MNSTDLFDLYYPGNDFASGCLKRRQVILEGFFYQFEGGMLLVLERMEFMFFKGLAGGKTAGFQSEVSI